MPFLLRHASIRRFLPIGLSVILNAGLVMSAMILSAAARHPQETQIAVELQQLPEHQVSTALPLPSPRLRDIQKRAEEIIKQRASQPQSHRKPVEEMLELTPVTPLPVPMPAAPQSPIKQPAPPLFPAVENPPVAPSNPVLDVGTAPVATGPGQPVTAANGTSGTGASEHSPGVIVTGTPGVPVESPSAAAPGGINNFGNHPSTGSASTPSGGSTPVVSTQQPPSVEPIKTPTAPKGESRKGFARTSPQPLYPPDARDEGIQGTVRLRVEIDEHGAIVGEPKVVKSSGNRSLDRAAQRGIRKWDFEPEITEGTPVRSTQVVEVRFSLY